MVTAFVLVFDSGILLPVTEQISDNTYQYLGSVGAGVFASVPENEINVLTAQISERERSLDEREALIKEREIAARTFEGQSGGTSDYSTYIISFILFIISVLLVLNYAMDWTRVKQGYYAKQVG